MTNNQNQATELTFTQKSEIAQKAFFDVFTASNVNSGKTLREMYEMRDALDNKTSLIMCRAFYKMSEKGCNEWQDELDGEKVKKYAGNFNKYACNELKVAPATLANYLFVGRFLDDNGNCNGLYIDEKDKGIEYGYQQLLEILRLCRKGLEGKKQSEKDSTAIERIQALATNGYIRPCYNSKTMENQVTKGLRELFGVLIGKPEKVVTKPTQVENTESTTESTTESNESKTESKTENKQDENPTQALYKQLYSSLKFIKNTLKIESVQEALEYVEKALKK